VGTFQFFAARGDVDGVRLLADHVIERHYPEATKTKRPYRAFLDGVISRQANLIAQWLLVGFIHGVMNTDNMSVAGETIDFGPCAFMDAYDPAKVFSSIDEGGRYAYANQPGIALWNLTRLAETLLPLLDDDENRAIADAEQALVGFGPRFEAAYHNGLRRKLGLSTERDGDLALMEALLTAMATQGADFTLTFRRPSAAAKDPAADQEVRALFGDPSAYDSWAVQWRQRLSEEPQDPGVRAGSMELANPAFIPRNHRIEAMIQAAVKRDDFSLFEELVTVLSKPYEDQRAFAHYADPPEPHEIVQRTFCGT
jgi:uncharacterized protein YdiU (UPF0061 family)